VKLLIVGDCHGKIPDLPEEDFDAVLCVGDICGDDEGVRELMFEAAETGEEWYEALGEEEARESVESSLEEGREVLEYLSSFEKPVYVVPGNWDWTGENSEWEFLNGNRFQELLEDFEKVRNVNFNKYDLAGFVVIGYGPCPAPELPQYADNIPDETGDLVRDYRESRMRLDQLFQQAEKPVIFLTHNPPFDTELDEVKEENEIRHYGSLLVRDMVQRHRPVFTASGHIHESEGKYRLGDIICVNAGLESAATVELEDFEVEEIEFDS